MKVACIFIIASFAAVALADDLQTVNGKEYKNATVSRVEADGIVIKSKSGITKIYFTELPKEVQERFGYGAINHDANTAEQKAEVDAGYAAEQKAKLEAAWKRQDVPVPVDVELKKAPAGAKFLVCNITFNGTLPPPETVDKIVHDSLQSAALRYPTQEILAMAWHGDDALTENQYSGNLIYKPAERRIMTLDESRGVKTTGVDVGAYYVAVTEDKTLAGIKPERKWLELSIVFPSTPSVQAAIDAAIAEIENRVAQGLDIDAYVKIGNKDVKTSWQQMPDPLGGFLYFHYTVRDRTIYDERTLIKKLP
jgi:hypothetical protein